MILVDSSVWVDYLATAIAHGVDLLHRDRGFERIAACTPLRTVSI